MKPRATLSIALLFLFCLSLFSSSVLHGAATERTFHLDPAETSSHAGQMAVVCGVVASAKYSETTGGSPTFLNLDHAYPDHVFTILIWGIHRSAFGQPEQTLAGKRICVSGRIEMYRGRPEIVAKVPSQIWLDAPK